MTYRNDTGFPSVTEILRPWIATDWFTPEACARGSWVHEAIAWYLAPGPEYMAPDPPSDPAWQGYVDSARRWIDANVAEPLIVERRLVDAARGYCGQLDLLCRMKSGETALLDWKTGQAVSDWWSLQLVAYDHLQAAETGAHADRLFSIRPKPDGSGCLPAHEVTDRARCWDVFQWALGVNKFFNGGK